MFALISSINFRVSLSLRPFGMPFLNASKSSATAALRIFVPEIAKVSPSASRSPEDTTSIFLKKKSKALY